MDKLNFFVEATVFEKSENNIIHRYVKGFASTPDEDREGEFLNQYGFNIKPLLEYGWINYDHDKKELCGIPIRAEITEKGLYLEAELLDNANGRRIWETAEALTKTTAKRNFGFSVEGKVLERDKHNPKLVKRAIITDIAITPKPVNKFTTFEAFSKALVAGYDNPVVSGGGALREQSLAGGLTNTSFDIDIPEFDIEDNKANGDILSKDQAIVFLKKIGFCEKDADKVYEYTKAKGV